jgi:hypothetical protein
MRQARGEPESPCRHSARLTFLSLPRLSAGAVCAGCGSRSVPVAGHWRLPTRCACGRICLRRTRNPPAAQARRSASSY